MSKQKGKLTQKDISKLIDIMSKQKPVSKEGMKIVDMRDYSKELGAYGASEYFGGINDGK